MGLRCHPRQLSRTPDSVVAVDNKKESEQFFVLTAVRGIIVDKMWIFPCCASGVDPLPVIGG